MTIVLVVFIVIVIVIVVAVVGVVVVVIGNISQNYKCFWRDLIEDKSLYSDCVSVSEIMSYQNLRRMNKEKRE